MASVLFVYPPTADPTGPYLSIPYLTAACRARGHETAAVDLNLRAWRDLLTRDRLEQIASECRERLRRLPASGLDHEQAQEYLALALCQHDGANIASRVESAVQTMRDPVGFFDPLRYDAAFSILDRAMAMISARYHPLELSFTQYRSPFQLNDASEIAHEAEPARNPFFSSYLEHLFPVIERVRPDVIGFSATFNAQLQQTFSIGRVLKSRYPDVAVVAGGTAITQLVLRGDRTSICELEPFLDAVILYEGEKSLSDVLDRIDAGTPWHDVNNVVSLDPSVPPADRRADHIELDAWPCPDFSDLPLGEYLAPELFLYVAPTRGCYWEKCAFCHYGLTDHGVAPYRRRRVDRFIDDLAELSSKHGARYFYFAGDLIDPAYLFQFADRVIDRGLDIRFTSDLRIERSFSAERCARLRRAGLVAAAFGTESDSPRLLQLMEKGTDPQANRQVFRNFAEAGIAVQAMTFMDFPTETAAEAHATLDLIQKNADAIDLFFVEQFDLEAGSRVFTDPARYDVEEVFYPAGDRYRFHARYVPRVACKSDDEYPKLIRRLDDLSKRYGRRPYPFAGSVSVAHTILYFDRFGRHAFKAPGSNGTSEAKVSDFEVLRSTPHIPDGYALGDWPYDLEMLADYVGETAQRLSQEREMVLRDVGRRAYEGLVAGLDPVLPRVSYYLFPQVGPPVPIPDWVWRLLSCLDGEVTVAEAAEDLDLSPRHAAEVVRALLLRGYLERATVRRPAT